MRRPSSTALLKYSLITIIWVLSGRARAEPYFRAAQALPPSHSVDVLVWLFDSTATDSLWDCVRADSSAIKPANCGVRAYSHPNTRPDKYLYWAFLNLNPRSDRADLKDFKFRNSTQQPDGSGSEIQFRLYAGSYYRIRYSED